MEKILVCLCAACGVGKSTIKDYLHDNNMLENYEIIDTDEVGLNWWDYANTENPDQYTIDSIKRASEVAGSKNLFFASCLCPAKLFDSINIPNEITKTYLIGMACSSEDIRSRLKARDTSRMCGDDTFIAGEITYNDWFKKRANRFSLFINTSNCTVKEGAQIIANFIRKVSDI